MFDPGPRLRCAAELILPHKKIVDIGTDHAYLPTYLVLTGKSERVLACDIGVRPLENARKTVNCFGLSDKIQLRISDGLQKVSADEAEEISICGMGGTLMAEILGAAEWIKRSGMHLVLQPMTHSEDVRQFLCKNGFSITRECFVEERSKVYCVISAHYSGEAEAFDEGFCYFGYLPVTDDIQEAYVSSRLKQLDKKLMALRNSHGDEAEVGRLEEIRRYYEERIHNENI